MKKAIVIGGTGMVGRELIKQLAADDSFYEIISFVRRRSGFTHQKLVEHLVDFDKAAEWQHLLLAGDVLFSCLGTTRSKAGSKDAQYQVDFCYQYEIAQFASASVPHYVLISSAGANASTNNFYLHMKGQLDDAVRTLPFSTINIIRPGQLTGNRIENRPLERLSLLLIQALNQLGILKKYRPIQATTVARAMIQASKSNCSEVYTLDEVFSLALQ